MLSVFAPKIHRQQGQFGAIFGPFVYYVEPKVEVFGDL